MWLTLAFTCRARLNDRPTAEEDGRTSAPCLVQRVVELSRCAAALISGGCKDHKLPPGRTLC